ncbi:MAG: UvrD-helicase domain-containing protein, partial [Candidatus Limnocylindrus sp.]
MALCDRVTAPHAAALRAILVEMGERLQREKDQLGVLSFGDLLLRMRDLLRDQPDVRARVKGRYDRILVDEYQDTSPVQEDLVAFLSEEPTRGDRIAQGQRAMGQLRLAPGRLFVVGDPKQSIYGFRGADVMVFRNTLWGVVEGTAQAPPSGRARPLSVSWRSRPPVLALVNQVALQTLPAGGAGVEVAPEDMLQSQRLGDGPAGAFWVPVDAEQLEVESAEGIVVGRKIRDLIDQATLVGDESSLRPCRPGDIVVLVRRVKAAAPIVRALLHHGIPALLTGGEGFFQRPEVVDLIAALQLVLEPQDELATLTVLRSPLVAAPDDVIAQLPECIPGWRAGLCWRDMPGAAEHLDDAVRHRILFFDNLLTSLRHRLHQWSAAQMIDELLDQGRYAIALGVEPDAADRLANVEKLRALCEGGPGDAVRVIRRLWGWLDRPPRESMAVVAAPDADAVRIMSIHQAKGLEFPIVVLADVGSALPGGGNDVEVDVELGLAVSPRGRPIEGCGRGTRGLVEPPTIERVRQRRRAREEAELARL